MTHFDDVPNSLKQQFSRVRRSSGGTQDSYGDATFTEVTTTGYRGFFQIGNKQGETVTIAGKEISYDAVAYTHATMLVNENDVLLFGSSTATAISTRYHIQGVKNVYNGLTIDHRELYLKKEVVA